MTVPEVHQKTLERRQMLHQCGGTASNDRQLDFKQPIEPQLGFCFLHFSLQIFDTLVDTRAHREMIIIIKTREEHSERTSIDDGGEKKNQIKKLNCFCFPIFIALIQIHLVHDNSIKCSKCKIRL